MELIVILLGELLFAPFIAALTVVLELIAILIGGVLDVVSGRIAANKPSITLDTQAGIKVPRRWSRILLLSAASLALVTFGILLAMNLFWFEGTVAWVLDRVNKKTGVQVTYESASGSLIGGHLRLEGVSIRQAKGRRTRCDLKLESAECELSMSTLLRATIVVDSLRLKKLRGSFTRLQDDPISPGRRTTKAFEIRSLAIEDLDVQVTDRTSGERTYRLAVASWRSEPLRSRWLPFDVLFRTNCAGTLAGSDFEIQTGTIEGGRETRWKASNLPGWYLANQLRGPFDLIHQGTVDVEVDDRWTRGDITQIDSRWRLVFRDVRAEGPAGMTLKQRLWARPWVAALNKLGAVPLEFRLTFDGSRLTTYSSPESKGVWREVGIAMVKQLLGVTGK